MKTLDEVADMLSKEGRGFAVVQYEAKDGKGVEYRYKAEDIETMLGFLIPIVDSICTEYVENEGYSVCESIRQTVEKTMMMNDTRPSDELFKKSIERLREIFAKYYIEPEEDDEEENPPLTFYEVREMLDKPVWMEWNNVKGWRLVNCFDSVTTGKKAVALTDRFGVDFVFDEETFEKCEVKVYRKEHHEDA